jgi:nucleoside-specific outer membrane channel protein Tsx
MVGTAMAEARPAPGQGVNENKGHKMKLRHLIFAAILTVTATQARAQFSDTWIGVRDGTNIANPGETKGGRDVNKIIVNVGHFDVWDYGSNFFSVDGLFSNANEPANNSAGGSTEFYAVYRGQLSPDKIFGLNTAFGPFSAINFEFGGDWESENTTFAPDKKALVAGPNFHLALPAGFLNVGVHVYKEWNNNGICNGNTAAGGCIFNGGSGGPVSFTPTAEFEIVWLVPLGFTGMPLDFRGFTNIVLPKGKDGFGNQTATEVLARPQINLDIGKLTLGKPNKLYLYFQVELWLNKFGNDGSLKVAGVKQNVSVDEISPVFGIEYHF